MQIELMIVCAMLNVNAHFTIEGSVKVENTVDANSKEISGEYTSFL